jgi:hypothetical protein
VSAVPDSLSRRTPSNGVDLSALVKDSDALRVVRAGEPVFAIDDPGSSMFVVRSGSIEIRIGDLVYETVGAGGIIGEMALLDPEIRVRSATAVAKTDCVIAEIGRARLLELIGAHPQIGLELCQLIVRRLRATTFLTHHDALTHLPNRHRFHELCRAALSRAGAKPVGLMLVGIDYFARLNESFGNAVGDEVLRAIGARLGHGRDAPEPVARLGPINSPCCSKGTRATKSSRRPPSARCATSPARSAFRARTSTSPRASASAAIRRMARTRRR